MLLSVGRSKRKLPFIEVVVIHCIKIGCDVLSNYVDITVNNFPIISQLTMEAYVIPVSNIKITILEGYKYKWIDKIGHKWSDLVGITNEQFVSELK